MQIKAGDTVVVIAGKDKFTKDKKGNPTPTTGKVLKVYPATNKVVVEGVNKVKKHKKPTQANPDGGIVEEEAPIDASNVAYYDTKAKEIVKLGYKFEDGKKVRVNKKTGAVIENKKK